MLQIKEVRKVAEIYGNNPKATEEEIASEELAKAE